MIKTRILQYIVLHVLKRIAGVRIKVADIVGEYTCKEEM